MTRVLLTSVLVTSASEDDGASASAASAGATTPERASAIDVGERKHRATAQANRV